MIFALCRRAGEAPPDEQERAEVSAMQCQTRAVGLHTHLDSVPYPGGVGEAWETQTPSPSASWRFLPPPNSSSSPSPLQGPRHPHSEADPHAFAHTDPSHPSSIHSTKPSLQLPLKEVSCKLQSLTMSPVHPLICPVVPWLLSQTTSSRAPAVCTTTLHTVGFTTLANYVPCSLASSGTVSALGLPPKDPLLLPGGCPSSVS